MEGAYAWSLKDFQLGKPIAKGCSAVVYSARLNPSPSKAESSPGSLPDGGQCQQKVPTSESDKVEEEKYPYAIKMMFNYHAESNALVILRAMQRETVAARAVSLPRELTYAVGSLGSMVHVDPHPNIVE